VSLKKNHTTTKKQNLRVKRIFQGVKDIIDTEKALWNLSTGSGLRVSSCFLPSVVIAVLQMGITLPSEQKSGHESSPVLPCTDQATQRDPPLLTLWLHPALAMLIKCHMTLSVHAPGRWVLGGTQRV